MDWLNYCQFSISQNVRFTICLLLNLTTFLTPCVVSHEISLQLYLETYLFVTESNVYWVYSRTKNRSIQIYFYQIISLHSCKCNYKIFQISVNPPEIVLFWCSNCGLKFLALTDKNEIAQPGTVFSLKLIVAISRPSSNLNND
jgi:hypothetical protein